jgi:hypothetical protein
MHQHFVIPALFVPPMSFSLKDALIVAAVSGITTLNVGPLSHLATDY